MSYKGWIDSGQGFGAWKKAMEAQKLAQVAKVDADLAADVAQMIEHSRDNTIQLTRFTTRKNETDQPSYYARTAGRLTEKTADIHESIDAAFDRLSKDAAGAE